MPDERLDSISQGIHAPQESPSGTAAEQERLRKLREDPPIDGAMGGTSDESSAAQEAQMEAGRAVPRPGRSPLDSPDE